MRMLQAGITLAFVFSLNGCGPTIGSTFRDYGGYSELRPPMTLVPPGTVVEYQQREPATLGIVCTQAASLGNNFEVPESPTFNQDLVKAVNKTFDMDANYLKQIKLDAKYSSVKNIKLTVSNATVAQLSADTVYENVKFRKPECQRAINDFIGNKRAISMIVSILKADVDYTVEFDHSGQFNASAEEEIMKGVAAQLGATYKSTGNQRISGDGLYWGIKDDASFALLQKDSPPSRTTASDLNSKPPAPITIIPIGPLAPGLTGTWVGISNEIVDKKSLAHEIQEEVVELKYDNGIVSGINRRGNYIWNSTGYLRDGHLVLAYRTESPTGRGFGVYFLKDEDGLEKVFVGYVEGKDCLMEKIVKYRYVLVKGNLGSNEVEAAKRRYGEVLAQKGEPVDVAACN